MDMWKCHTTAKQLPIPDEDSLVFWEGCRRERLLIQQCDACKTYRFPPSPRCPACLSALATWCEEPGTGEILTFCVYYSELAGQAWQAELPYVVAVIRMRCSGVRILSQVLVDTPDTVRIGQGVEVIYEPAGDAMTLPKFRVLDKTKGPGHILSDRG